jgi:SAM-dependent methyltransferase
MPTQTGGPGGDADPRAFFGQHAAAYAKSEGHKSGADLEMVVRALSPLDGRDCLDVATGTGFCALALARAGGHLTAVDLTEEMLAETARLAAAEGVDIVLATGDATRLPFADESFDRVSCRRAAHHFDDVAQAVREAFRVLRPGGRLAIADMAPRADASALQDSIERMRDPSHRHALTPEEWRKTFEDAGFEAIGIELWHERQDFSQWYYPVTDAAARARIAAAMDGAPPDAARALGLRRDDGAGWSLVKQRAVVVGVRPG